MLFKLAKVITVALTLILCILAVSLSTVFLQTYREYKSFRAREQEQTERLAKVRRDLLQQEQYLRLILTDNAFLERVVRQKLGYARPEEFVFVFESAPPR